MKALAAIAAVSGLVLGCVSTRIGWKVGPGGAEVSCEQTCHERTDYGERCVEFARQATWCDQLLHGATPARASGGWSTGTPTLGCGCYGAWPPGVLTDPVCASGYSQVAACPAYCPMGGIAYGYTCS